MAERVREGSTIHDGEVPYLAGCPRRRTDCTAMARVSSPSFECPCEEFIPEHPEATEDTVVLCVPCSEAGGGEKAVYHAPPACPSGEPGAEHG